MRSPFSRAFHFSGKGHLESNKAPFGKNAIQIFKKPQSMSGLGAAIGKLVDFEIISDISNLLSIINEINEDDPKLFLEEINNSLAWIKDNSKKIGNAQRTYFTYFFRDLFNKDGDSFLILKNAAKSALRKYQAQNT